MFTHYKISGGNPLKGDVKISGAKNGALPLLFASLLTNEKVILHNIPDISDIHTTIKVLEHLGSEVTFEGETITINNEKLKNKEIPHELVSRMRAAIYALGALITRFKHVKTAFPGGCVIGRRGIDSHTRAIQDLGAKVVKADEVIELKAKKLTGTTITLREMSVGATVNAVLAAVMAEGETVIKVAAPEPEIQSLCNFINEMGGHITGIGSNTLRIRGVEKLHGCEFTNIPDRIEATTFACLAAFVDGSEVTLNNIDNDHLDMFWARMEDTGVDFTLPNKHTAIIKAKSEYNAIPNCDTRVYPHFATDSVPPFAVLLTKANGVSKIFETIFTGRLGYLDELTKMGATTEILNPHQGIVVGPTELRGADLQSHDLRAGAAVVVAALGAKGESRISGISYIKRGYAHFVEKLQALGADITENEE